MPLFSCLWLPVISINCEQEKAISRGLEGGQPEDISLSAKRHLEPYERSAVVVRESVSV